MFRLAPGKSTVEDLFLERYDWLLERARHLTQGSRQRAQDLVHDLFVELTLGPPDVGTVRNLDAYLYAILRNLHISELRRGLRFPTRPLSVVDYDTLEVALRHVDPLGSLETAEELCSVCTWACARKAASKTGSVLILRFFYGYSPRETGDIMRTSAGAVDEWLRRARREARVALRAQAFAGAAATVAAHPILPRLIADSDEPLTELRGEIARWRTDGCLDPEILSARYTASSSDSIDCALVAHLVSCRDCLGRVARILGLRDPWQEPPADGLGPEGSARRTRRRRRLVGDKDAMRREAIAAARESVREIFDCRPTELFVAVNGLIVASQTTGSDESRMTIQLGATDRLEFVEVLTNDHRRLLLLPVDAEPDGALEQQSSRALSDSRSLTAFVHLAGATPTVSVTYEPGIAEVEESAFATVVLGSGLGASHSSVGRSLLSTLSRWRSGATPRSPWTIFARGLVTAVVVFWLVLGGGEAIASAAARAGAAVWRWVVSIQEKLQPTPNRPIGLRNIPPADIHLPATAVPTVVPKTVAALPRRLFSEAELADIEVGALEALDQAEALLAEDLRITRDAASGVHVSIVANGMERARALGQALQPLQAAAGLKVSIVTPRETLTDVPRVLAYREFQVERDRTPVWVDLHGYFAQRAGSSGAVASGGGTPTWVDGEAREYSRRVVATSQNAVQHTWAMKRLLERFESGELRRLNAAAHATWRDLIERHALLYQQELSRLRAHLLMVFPSARPGVANTRQNTEGAADWRDSVQRLIDVGAAINDSVQRSFTASSGAQNGNEAPVKMAGFWDMVGEADRLSTHIRKQAP